MALATDAPVPPADLSIECFAGLPSGDAVATWRFVGELALGGLANAGSTCYATAVAQVLLRVPAVAVWLHVHATQCEGIGRPGIDSASRCVSCALWATRLQLGSAALPELVRHRGEIDKIFEEGGQQDAAEFAQLILKRMRVGELQAERAAEWPLAASEVGRVTHVDRLFGFVQETRLM